MGYLEPQAEVEAASTTIMIEGFCVKAFGLKAPFATPPSLDVRALSDKSFQLML